MFNQRRQQSSSSRQGTNASSDRSVQRKSNHDKSRRKHPQHNSRNNERGRWSNDIASSFKMLEKLSEKEPIAIVLEITGQENGFRQLLDSELSDDRIVLIVKVLAQVCLSETVTSKATIMIMASKDAFHSSLQRFVFSLIVQTLEDRNRSSYFWKDPKAFFSNSAVVFRTLIDSVPSRACEVLPKTLKAFTVTFASIQGAVIDEEILNAFDTLKNMLELCKLEKPKKVEESKSKNEVYDDSNVEPPDDFRKLNIYPTKNDVLLRAGYLRKNLIDKGYNGVAHYLDVQFRLLKEDFVGPLRNGIAEYMRYTGPPKEVIKVSDVRVYTNVRFVSFQSAGNRFGVLVQFQPKHKNLQHKINLSKRFMFGSLLCFTTDNFQSLLFGKVMERNMELLEQNHVIVGFEVNVDNNLLNQTFVMVECSVYFEPYYHVLKALQNMDEAQFPMKKYLIDLNADIDVISYLQPTSMYTVEDHLVQVNDPNAWPGVRNLGLDQTQYDAFRSALTKELVVIQGPPGTGKTYLGLKIAKTLIQNETHWYNSNPILVVCYTNHALDQFLEGLRETTNKIVRIGGQSKNKNIEEFTLKEKRRLFRRTQMNYRPLNAVEDKLYTCLNHVNYYNGILKAIESNSVLINFREFSVIDDDITSSWFFKASDEQMIAWLLTGRTKKERDFEQNKVKIRELEDSIQKEPESDLHDEFDEILYNQTRDAREIDIDFDIRIQESTKHVLTSVQDIKLLINTINNELKSSTTPKGQVRYKKLELYKKRGRLLKDLQYLEVQLQKYENIQVKNKPRSCNLMNPHNMPGNDRWHLYLYWLNLYQQHVRKQLMQLHNYYKTIEEQYNEIRDIFDLQIMKEMSVVGMTTTGAARLQTLIRNLKSPIVIVEEAAEVLESHVVVSLTSHCKHLILIGDHQQLRPSTSNYYIERHFNLGISLFERMVRNNMHCHVLGVQHRMRPEFANLIVPAIYPKLENHASVYDFPSIVGIAKNLYFIDHTFREEESSDSSKFNMHEAKFLIALARYLIQNGYKSEDITIIGAYSAQMFALWKEQRKCPELLQGVRITVLDNYQGEESKIILLSLVRNNNEGKIGFLKIENRVCVALSRAKEGFYIMGNMNLLCKESGLWVKIRTVLESQDSLGTSLLLRCQIHPEHETSITLPGDFSNVAEGGCNKACGMQLACGHVCTMLCHVLDRVHEKFKCKVKCTKILCENNHTCPGLCYEQCQPCGVPMLKILPCGHEHYLPCHLNINDFKCPTPVKTTLECGHEDPNKPCHYPIDSYNCPFPCDTRVEPCGHACLRLCHIKSDPDHLKYECRKPCERPRLGCSTEKHKCSQQCYEECIPCDIAVRKKRSCTHTVMVPCSKNPDEIECHQKCKRLLPCGHACKKKCREPCGECNVQVLKKITECGHETKTGCSETPSRRRCYQKCASLLPCGHVCKNVCNQPCATSCKELVDHTNQTACGHTFKIECHMLQKEYTSKSYDLLKFCRSPCGATLSCSHTCSGSCGECAQGRIHKACTEKCGAVLVCGHPCPINCRDGCRPCETKCTYKCRHSKCKKKCGEPCTKCTERCTRKCLHVECMALCGDVCTVPPCDKPCLMKLSCGHFCVGFCGDPCPRLCRECDREELTEIFFGDEDEETARFVMLDECQHVFESTGMEKWLQGSEEDQTKIAPKRCPRCKTVLTSTQRYSDHIKKALLDLFVVKEKYFGSRVDNERRRSELLNKILTLKENQILMRGTHFVKVLETFENSIAPVINGRRQSFNLMLYMVYSAKLRIVENIVAVYKKGNLKTNSLIGQINFFFSSLLKNEKKLSKQEATDLQKELERFFLVVQLRKISESVYFSQLSSKPEFLDVFKDISTDLFSIKIFTDDSKKKVENKLDYLSETFNVEVSKIEFKLTINAMGMSKGHWFKCPNGHIYAIGECGGAMQTGRCADCGEAIGGTSHTLVPTNRHAGEVDESAHAAYSEEANNLFNYEEFRNF
ncbi:hypothetical protein RN001_014875 [Aquatica leii]|uniref:RZ-type domain-containing protein n=1 Tax=Aquatica leii TaxID=1421715 RepID=A0AAN7P078_9COLE|nr:hypothetical protein RN001_014875 [Aquatica leii]